MKIIKLISIKALICKHCIKWILFVLLDTIFNKIIKWKIKIKIILWLLYS